MPIPSTLNKCTPTAVTPLPRYRAPKRHFLPAPPMRPPTQSATPPSSQARPTLPPSRSETELLLSLLSQLEGRSPTMTSPLRPNQLAPLPLTRTERIMLRHPSPSPRSSHGPRRAHPRPLCRFPRDLSLITSLRLIAVIAVCSLALIQIGSATARKTCPPSGGGLKPLSNSGQQ